MPRVVTISQDNVFSSLDSDTIAAIKAMGKVTVDDFFSSGQGNEFDYQNPPIAQNWVQIANQNTAPTFQWAVDGQSEYTLNLTKGLQHIQEVVCDFSFTFVDPTPGTNPAMAPLGPYFWFYYFTLVQGSLIIYPYIDPIYLYHFFFYRLKNELRNALFATASDQTVNGGVEQTIVMPMPNSRLLSGIERPAMPTRSFGVPLQIKFRPRKISDFTVNGSITTTAVINNLNFFAHTGFYETVANHTDDFFVGFEMPIFTQTNNATMVANVQNQVNLMSSVTGVAKCIYFLFQATADMAANVRKVFAGGMPTQIEFHPGGANPLYNISGAQMIKILQLSNWYDINLYNAVTTATIATTWTSCLNYPFGPKYTVADLLSSYYNVGSNDKTFMNMTYAVAGLCVPLVIMYRILKLSADKATLQFVESLN